MEEIEKTDITNKLNLVMILLLTISTIVIASFILFFIGVTRVEAATADFTSIGIREESADGTINNFTTVTTYPFTDTQQGSIVGTNLNWLSRRRYIGYLTYNFTKGNMYNISFTIRSNLVYVDTEGGVMNWGANSLEFFWIDNTKVACNVQGEQSVTNALVNTGKSKTYVLNVTCVNIVPSKNQTQLRFRYNYPTIDNFPSLYKQEFTLTAKPTLSYETKVDTDAIISNNDSNTQDNMNNNNANTDRIIENDNQNTNKIINNNTQQTDRIINNNNQNSQAIQGSIDAQTNMDLDPADKQQPNNGGVNSYIESESDLMSQMNTSHLDDVDISIDLNSNTWIWTTMTSFFNTNAAIMTMVISILSIGVIKLVLTR